MKYLFIILGLCVSGCASTPLTTVRQSAAYHHETVSKREILLLPTEVMIHRVDMSDKRERVYEYESHMEDLINASLREVLREKGYQATRLTRQAIHGMGISGGVLNLEQKYHAALGDLYVSEYLPVDQALAMDMSVGKPDIHFKNGQEHTLLLLSY